MIWTHTGCVHCLVNKSFQPPVIQHLKNHLISQKLAPLCNRRLLVNLEKKLPSYWTTVGNLPGYHLKEGSAGYWDCGCFSLNARTASGIRHFSVVLLWQPGIKESEDKPCSQLAGTWQPFSGPASPAAVWKGSPGFPLQGMTLKSRSFVHRSFLCSLCMTANQPRRLH